ncbi:crotonase/enoyl-CoA hydratase family protein [Paraferrimonas sp. SM1919]|uniref:crotonase/enoyl-CoA hydratase family protein n=1 Tax=Paraferrimonas sp. SM1919 TaxID=2662263 RepID=UPI0013D267FA|nr:crotonase/enoyl-CoA hydratase family protein [Paraferrimonas sp. SM1919]
MQLTTTTLTIENQIAVVTLNRPAKMNGVNMAMFNELRYLAKKLKSDTSIRAVIITGAGGNFSAGLDFKAMTSSPLYAFKLLFKWLPGNANRAQQVSSLWRKIAVPVIAVIEGYCWGAGMQIALGCDFRFCHHDAKLAVMESKMGLVPDMAGTLGMREHLSKDIAMKLTMTSESISAEQAIALGLVTQVSSTPMDDALDFCEQIKQKSPDAIAGIKSIYARFWNASPRTILAYETYSQVRVAIGKNFAKVQQALNKKVAARFSNRQKFW